MHWLTKVGGAFMGASTGAIFADSSNNPKQKSREQRLEQSIENSIEHCENIQRQLGLPGLAVAVSVNGNVIFEKGFGYADVENNFPMKPNSVMRIASISKSITGAMLAKQMEDGKVDIDLPIQTYIPDFPQKKWEGKPVTITTRHLLSHTSGIRHYLKKEEIEKKKENYKDSDFIEFFMKTSCDNVAKAMELFKNDELIHKPGTKYSYTTHGFTVVSAVVEKATETPFDKHCKRMFKFWGLKDTYLDQHDPIIPNRARYYRRKKGALINAPWVDNSCKWAGGGFLSTVQDLIRFSNIMLHSVQQPEISNSSVKPFLKKETVEQLWTGEKSTTEPFVESLYGLGWAVTEPFSNCRACSSKDDKHIAHSGGAIGASSILSIQLPLETSKGNCYEGQKDGEIKGVVVAMITNLQDASLSSTAKKLSTEFQWMMDSS